ncbi:MAG: hypothetical protein H6779_04705 [Candidatus Nomurabacteria bacterium]|nr:hypothetical protein [Candidatus Nomurabacteria bacterium]USN87674.1 MAG: hypothetical protein H6779_04705 [Candidatus Nomurabacteria bacterium]
MGYWPEIAAVIVLTIIVIYIIYTQPNNTSAVSNSTKNVGVWTKNKPYLLPEFLALLLIVVWIFYDDINISSLLSFFGDFTTSQPGAYLSTYLGEWTGTVLWILKIVVALWVISIIYGWWKNKGSLSVSWALFWVIVLVLCGIILSIAYSIYYKDSGDNKETVSIDTEPVVFKFINGKDGDTETYAVPINKIVEVRVPTPGPEHMKRRPNEVLAFWACDKVLEPKKLPFEVMFEQINTPRSPVIQWRIAPDSFRKLTDNGTMWVRLQVTLRLGSLHKNPCS